METDVNNNNNNNNNSNMNPIIDQNIDKTIENESTIKNIENQNILNETTFTKLLVDYALAESAANLNIKNVSLLRLDSTYAFAPLKENNISRTKYDSTLMFYSKHTILYKKIYENVLAELSEIKTARDTLKMDSIHKKQISRSH
jgi:hypothetical protein